MKYLVPVLAGLSLAACDFDTSGTGSSNEAFTPDASAVNIEAHIRFLASDYLAGRDAGSDGYEIAANYVASQMRLLGLQPAGDNGSYFAAVPMHDIHADTDFNQMVFDGTTYANGEDIVIWPNPSVQEAEVTGELVFAGYGVVSPDRGHDDYADIDVEGKIVVLFDGVPDIFPSEERAHHNSSNTKRQQAADRGAIAVITVSTNGTDAIANMASGFGSASFTALTPATGSSPFDQIRAHGTVSADLGAQFFEGAEMSLEDVRAAMNAEDGASYPHFDLPHTVTLRQRTIWEPFSDPNVVGMIEGSDPELRDEVVVLSAHLDHIGAITDHMRGGGQCRSSDDDDQICNGAVDNASGVSIMLETARTFLEEGTPRRSILFVALAAEEKGLLGSQHFARNPTVDADRMVANVNLDMPVIVYDFADVIAFGSDHSNLGPIATRAAARLGINVSEDPLPEQSLFVRSDHYNFVREGVPSLFLMTGFSSPDPRWDEGEGFMGFLNTHYHRQTDQLDGELEVLFEQGAKFANINYIIAREIADSDERPAWNEDSYFGNLFGRED